MSELYSVRITDLPKDYKKKRVYLDTNILLPYIATRIPNEKLKRRIATPDIYNVLDNWCSVAEEVNVRFGVTPTVLGEVVMNLFQIIDEEPEWHYFYDKAIESINVLVSDDLLIDMVRFGRMEDSAERIRFEMFVDILEKIKDREARSNYADRVILAFSASDPNSFGLLTKDQKLLGDINKKVFVDTSFSCFKEQERKRRKKKKRRRTENNEIGIIEYIRCKRQEAEMRLKFFVAEDLEDLLGLIHKEESKGRG